MKPRGEERRQLARIGMIYNVERGRFDIIYRDLETSEIRIVSDEEQAADEPSTSVSAS